MLATGNKAKEECEWYGATRAVMHNSEELAAMRWALSNGVASLWIGTNCIKIGLPGKLILGDYVQENMTSQRPFLLLRIRFPGRPILYNCLQGDDEVEAIRESGAGVAHCPNSNNSIRSGNMDARRMRAGGVREAAVQ